jgi:hypothetical protein
MTKVLAVLAMLLVAVSCGNATPASTVESGEPAGLLPTVSATGEPTSDASGTTSARTAAPQTTTHATGAPVASPSRSPRETEPGISGQVVAGPTCPVERADSPCPDRPVTDAQVTISGSGYHHNTTTSSEGRFHSATPPGTYTVTASSPSVFGCDPQTVKVEPNRTTHVTVHCDTGIR